MAAEKEKERNFSKTDMERVALFQEMGYICVGDKFKPANSSMHFLLSAYYFQIMFLQYSSLIFFFKILCKFKLVA